MSTHRVKKVCVSSTSSIEQLKANCKLHKNDDGYKARASELIAQMEERAPAHKKTKARRFAAVLSKALEAHGCPLAQSIAACLDTGAVTLSDVNNMVDGPLGWHAVEINYNLLDARSNRAMLRFIKNTEQSLDNRRYAGLAIAWARSETGFQLILNELIHSTDDTVRECCAYSLTFMSDQRAIPHLNSLVSDRSVNPAVRAQALEAIGATVSNGDSFDVILDSLSDPDPRVRFWAAYGIMELGGMEHIEPLIKLLSDTAEVEYMWSVGKEARDAAHNIIFNHLQFGPFDKNSYQQYLKAIGSLGYVTDYDSAIVALDDENTVVRFWAAGALQCIDNVRAIDSLRQHESDKNLIDDFRSVGEAATNAIDKLLRMYEIYSDEEEQWPS